MGGAPPEGGAPPKFKMALIGLPIHVAHKMKHQFVALLRAHCMGTIKTWGGAPRGGHPPKNEIALIGLKFGMWTLDPLQNVFH